MVTMGEAYEIYLSKESHQTKVGKSYFYDLRPPNIIVVSSTPHNVCVCQKHANFDYKCSSLKHVKGFLQSYKTLLAKCCFDTSSEKCMLENCVECIADIKDICRLFSNLQCKYIH